MGRCRSITTANLVFLVLRCAGIAAACLMAGCVIKSSQLQELNQHLKDREIELKPYEWMLLWDKYQKKVYAVDMDPIYVFGNIYGDGITLQNFNLMEAQGLGQFNYLWQFFEKDGYVMAYESGHLRGTYQCSDWNFSLLSTDSTGAKQKCVRTDGKVYHNFIKLDPYGSIQEITYDLFGGKSALILKKM